MNYKWTTLTDKHDRAQAGARSLIKRAYRRWRKGVYRRWRKGNGALDQPPSGRMDLEAWARANFGALVRGLQWQVCEHVRQWTRGNNSGDLYTLGDCNERSRWHQENHDTVLALFGVKVDWPGLHPSYLYELGSYHNLPSLAAAMAPAYTRAVAMIRLDAGHDPNGNPRRLYVAFSEGGCIVGTWDEGYVGHKCVPRSLWPMAVQACTFKTTTREYLDGARGDWTK